jgi:predicted nucleotidyltransferase
MSEPTAFDPARLLRLLSDSGVEFVLIGGVAARLHGSPTLTRDVDICHARDPENLERLAAALGAIHARLRGVDEDVPFLLDARTLAAGSNFTFTTDDGDIDILAMPAGVEGYEELTRSAESFDIDGVRIRVAGLDALITMKRAAGRPKDRIEVEVLSALRDEVADEP